MSIRRIHLSLGAGRYLCGVGKGQRWPSSEITSTRSMAGVTCLQCRRLADAPPESVGSVGVCVSEKNLGGTQ